MAYQSKTKSKADLGYIRRRDAGQCVAFKFSPAHVLVLDVATGRAYIEILAAARPPRWLAVSKRLTRKAAMNLIRQTQDIAAHFKVLYLQMIQADGAALAQANRAWEVLA